jgi:3-oxoadipate enol-lactonase
MTLERPMPAATRELVELGDARLECFRSAADAGDSGRKRPLICAAHPASAFGADTAALLAATTGTEVVCINPRGLGGSSPSAEVSLPQMVDDLERARAQLGLPPWLFWGMSGGGWLAQLYADRHRDGLTGIVVESACACFRERLGDPSCALSPFFPAWRGELAARGLIAEDSHTQPSSAAAGEWVAVDGVGQVFRRPNGPALLVAPMPLDADMTRAIPALWAFDARSWLAAVRLPVLVVCGTADPVVPVQRVRQVHEAIAGSTFLAVEGAGHVPTSERRPEVAAAFERFVAGALAKRTR